MQPKKKKNLVEEKHPGDKGGCERDNRTKEIRDGRRGEKRRGEGHRGAVDWKETQKMQDRPPVLFSWVQGPLWQRCPLPKFFISPYTHIHTHTSSTHKQTFHKPMEANTHKQTFHKPSLPRESPASKWGIDGLCIIVKVTPPKSQPVIDPFPCTTQKILQHGSPKKWRQRSSKESTCWSFRSTEMKDGRGETEQMHLCGQCQRSL